jgi:hypothetical protein
MGAEAMSRLRGRSVCDVDPGLSLDEIEGVEKALGFQFASDHRAFLTAGLPVNTYPELREPGVVTTHREPWPDWRRPDVEALRARIAWPVEGVLFDVENNGFWYQAWRARPERLEEAVEIARRELTRVPIMVPLYGHRYLPAGAGTYGHPVLSMWQTDIIYYGLDIVDYIDREFGGPERGQDAAWEPRVTVDFWRDLV